VRQGTQVEVDFVRQAGVGVPVAERGRAHLPSHAGAVGDGRGEQRPDGRGDDGAGEIEAPVEEVHPLRREEVRQGGADLRAVVEGIQGENGRAGHEWTPAVAAD